MESSSGNGGGDQFDDLFVDSAHSQIETDLLVVKEASADQDFVPVHKRASQEEGV
eukprot:m.891973 g.891973  ORF g.891973 m.891973 type:complete len:55 (+) comp59970_c2_seq3:292-456(+)